MLNKSSKHIKPPPKLLILDSEGVPISYESPAEKQLRLKKENEKLEERIEGKLVSTYNEQSYLIPIHPFNDLGSSEVLNGFMNKTYITTLTLKNQLRYNVGFIDSKGHKNLLFYGINDIPKSCCSIRKLRELKIRLIYNRVNLDIHEKEILPLSFFTLIIHKPKERWSTICSGNNQVIDIYVNRHWIYSQEQNRILNEENKPVEVLLLKIFVMIPSFCGSIKFNIQNSSSESILQLKANTNLCNSKIVLNAKDLKNTNRFGRITVQNDVLMEPEFSNFEIEFDKNWGYLEKTAMICICLLVDNYLVSD